ncbi:MAG: ISKra4 family transposase, partial [Desulfomonilaceae bacterium]
MGSARSVGKAFFPLDEELGLLAGRLTPHAHECLVRLGAWMPFEKAAKELGFVLKVCVSEPTSRRYTETAGAAYVTYQAQAVAQLEQTAPLAPQGPQRMFLSVDGAMVPLVGGEWREVKTLTLGELEDPVCEDEEWVVHSREHSYFSRLANASDFQRLALVETHARGVEQAAVIAAVTDGAEWEQSFLDFHCPRAVRILDFPHAGEHLTPIGQALWGEQSEQTQLWLAEQRHRLKQSGPADLLADLHQLHEQHPHLEVLPKHLAYLESRQDHMRYPEYRAQGLPIGSGAMESGNKVVVEARLKGAGMHWAEGHVDPLLGLRNILCSDRWEEAWSQILGVLQQQEAQQRKTRYQNRHAEPPQITLADPPSQLESLPPSTAPALPPPAAPPSLPTTPLSRPAPNHPWRHSPI